MSDHEDEDGARDQETGFHARIGRHRYFIRYLAELQIFLSLCMIKLEFYPEKAISR
jgi:hypothetical protein